MARQAFHLPDNFFDSFEDENFDIEEENFDIEDAEVRNIYELFGIPIRSHEERGRMRDRDQATVSGFDFGHIASEISKNREMLALAYPREVEFPQGGRNSKIEWCIFCLGSRLCAKIYNEVYEEPVEEIVGHDPLLSTVIHLNQSTLYMLFKYLHEWYLSIGMEESLGGWIYAVLACFRYPYTGVIVTLAEIFNDEIEERLRFPCDRSIELRLYQISGILDVNFCISNKLENF